MNLDKRVIFGVVVILVILGASGGYYYWYLPAEQRRLAEEAKRAAEEVLKRKNALIPHPDTIVHLVFQDPQFLDPAVDYEPPGVYIIQNVYETLVWYKGAGLTKMEPVLAEAMPTISADGLTYTFKLRKNVKFHDGTPFNASCVKYSLDRIILINEVPARSYENAVKGVKKYINSNMTQADVKEFLATRGFEVIDEYTFRINLQQPYAPLLDLLCGGGSGTSARIVSPTAVEKHGGIVPGKHNDWMDTHMVGTGPYVFVEWVPRTRVVVEAFEGYWRGPAKIKKAIIQTVAELSSRELSLLVGEADMIGISAPNAFDIVQEGPWLKERRIVVRSDLSPSPQGTGISIVYGPSTQFYFISLNARFPPLDNKDFRYGLSYSFDQNTFINDAVGGFAESVKSCIPKGVLGGDEDVFSFTYDPAKAKEYFMKAKTAGVYQEGVKVKCFYNTGDELRRRGGLLLKDNVEKLNVGVTIDLQELDWPQFLRQIRAFTNPIYMGSNFYNLFDPDDFVRGFAYSKNPGSNGDRAKVVLGSEWDAKIERAVGLTDLAERKKLYGEIASRLNQEAHFIWTGQRFTFKVMRDWVRSRIDSEMGVSTQANPALAEYYLYDLWKGY
jgi:peptide/nickel transport system substrate-binding protein